MWTNAQSNKCQGCICTDTCLAASHQQCAWQAASNAASTEESSRVLVIHSVSTRILVCHQLFCGSDKANQQLNERGSSVAHISWSKCWISLCACRDVNQGSTNHNHCTQRLAILHIQTYQWTLIAQEKQGQSDLLYESKLPDENSGIFKPPESHTMLVCFQQWSYHVSRIRGCEEGLIGHSTSIDITSQLLAASA